MRAILLAILCAAPLAATPWDRDRPGDNHVARVDDCCAGRFDRLPARYYEMRIERLQPQTGPLEDEPAMASADDQAVALLRLGRVPDALQLLDRKQAALEVLRARDAMLYNAHTERTLKNKAMVLLARWRSASDAKDLEAAIALVRRAAELGRLNTENTLLLRELMFLQRKLPPTEAVFPNLLGLNEIALRRGGRPGALVAQKLEGALPHLQRRVTYGGEYDNADLFYALSLACAMEGRDDDAALCWARLCELIDAGAALHVTHWLGADALKTALAWHLKGDREGARGRLQQLHAAARIRNEERGARIAEALERGEHPDTMADFWTRWMDRPPQEPRAASSPGVPAREQDTKPLVGTALWIGGGAMVLFLFLVVGAVAIHFARRHPPPPKVDEL